MPSVLKIVVLITLIPFLTSCAKSAGDGTSSSYVAPIEPFPHLGTSASFAALGAQGVSNTGATTIYGDIGVSPGSQMTGLDTIKRTGGEIHQSDAVALQAQKDSLVAYQNLINKACDQDLSGQDLGGMTLTPGTYCFSGSAELTGLLTLDFQGNANADFVFKVGTTLTTAPDSGMRLLNNGESCNVFWQVASTATLGQGTNVVGGILSKGDITLDSGAKLNGKLISQNGLVTLNASEVYNNFCPWPGQ